ncbi:MAG: flagellar hook assembly protein FlgD [Spirochaetales bacterium]|nr:flagellar hook assembly protein FlgD [Spirochaetales bacterium]
MDAFVAQMTTTDLANVQAQAESFNRALNGTRVATDELGKDEFLKLLITQLTHQDPTEPMDDREFIAQMAQFSTLEQMTNLSSEFERLGGLLQSGQAVSLLGKTVDIVLGAATITGQVDEVTNGEYPQVLVNGFYYDYGDVQRIRTEEE